MPKSASSSSSTTRSIVAQTPCRADLAGSTLDLWPLYLFHSGAVTLNFAVSIMPTCRITPHAGKQIRLRSADTDREDRFASFDQLCRARDHSHALAARLVQFF